MSELIEAAKAVIAEWDDQQVVGDRKLRAAVERAESAKVDKEDELFAACMYGAKTEREKWVRAEREKWARAVRRMEEEHSYKYLDELLEMIDAPT